jgi:3-oxoacyl-(acyl-carrier-protein) synthase
MLSALTEGAVRGGLSQDSAAGFVEQITPALKGLVEAIGKAYAENAPAAAPAAAPATPPASVLSGQDVMLPMREVVCSGASIGLPGGDEVFGPDNFDRILSGENRISVLSDEMQDTLLAKNIVRLQKDSRTGQGEFMPVERREQVIRLAGVRSHFDLEEQYDVNPRRVGALDITTRLAFAAGLEAMRDAGLPIVQKFRETSTGKRIADRWSLPEPLRAGTGIIFASAFPGYDNFAQHMRTNGDDGEGRFDRRFLFQVLAMGHSQFAELIGACGPNTQINSACASTTQAVGIASDWIRTGRAERVIIIAADDVTSPRMLEWIGAGFLASGAATTKDRVEDAALPFDRRRHGMILGMGAVGLVLERAEDVLARGMTPLSRLLAARFCNSAYHGSRLHPTHISDEMDALVDEATRNASISREDSPGRRCS